MSWSVCVCACAGSVVTDHRKKRPEGLDVRPRQLELVIRDFRRDMGE